MKGDGSNGNVSYLSIINRLLNLLSTIRSRKGDFILQEKEINPSNYRSSNKRNRHGSRSKSSLMTQTKGSPAMVEPFFI